MTKISTPSPSNPEPTISDVEKAVQGGLEALRGAPLNAQIVAALKFLVPTGYRPVPQLEEDGRKKRSTAAASNWNPDTGGILIYFERVEPDAKPLHRTSAIQLRSDVAAFGSAIAELAERPANADAGVDSVQEVTSLQIQQCCEALAETEKAGKAFIALKWFRDTGLMAAGYSWADSLASRQAVLTKAIDVGAIVTSSIPNPKAPQHPTTTLKLNRESPYSKAVAPRYQPIRAKGGASASEIILRDRGRF